jgi:hypothetical protein
MNAVTLVQVFALFGIEIAPVAASLEAVLQILWTAIIADRDDSLVTGHNTTNTS